jgi:hypothetical protein
MTSDIKPTATGKYPMEGTRAIDVSAVIDSFSGECDSSSGCDSRIFSDGAD